MTLFKRNPEEKVRSGGILYPLAVGEIIPLERVENSVISSLIVGNGYALIPHNNNVYSPADGVVKNISNNGRAVTVLTDDGLIAVVHIGTVLHNAPFLKETVLKVSVGDRVEAGQLISETSIEAASRDGRDLTLLLIISNIDNVKHFKVNYGALKDIEAPAAYYEI